MPATPSEEYHGFFSALMEPKEHGSDLASGTEPAGFLERPARARCPTFSNPMVISAILAVKCVEMSGKKVEKGI